MPGFPLARGSAWAGGRDHTPSRVPQRRGTTSCRETAPLTYPLSLSSQCDVSMRLADGKIGDTALEAAEATATVDAERRCTFNASARPADAAGHLKLSGCVPLPQRAAEGEGGDQIQVGANEAGFKSLLLSSNRAV
jgi:hypothetical protein